MVVTVVAAPEVPCDALSALTRSSAYWTLDVTSHAPSNLHLSGRNVQQSRYLEVLSWVGQQAPVRLSAAHLLLPAHV